jgi:hypothetical protein
MVGAPPSPSVEFLPVQYCTAWLGLSPRELRVRSKRPSVAPLHVPGGALCLGMNPEMAKRLERVLD